MATWPVRVLTSITDLRSRLWSSPWSLVPLCPPPPGLHAIAWTVDHSSLWQETGVFWDHPNAPLPWGLDGHGHIILLRCKFSHKQIRLFFPPLLCNYKSMALWDRSETNVWEKAVSHVTLLRDVPETSRTRGHWWRHWRCSVCFSWSVSWGASGLGEVWWWLWQRVSAVTGPMQQRIFAIQPPRPYHTMIYALITNVPGLRGTI